MSSASRICTEDSVWRTIEQDALSPLREAGISHPDLPEMYRLFLDTPLRGEDVHRVLLQVHLLQFYEVIL